MCEDLIRQGEVKAERGLRDEGQDKQELVSYAAASLQIWVSLHRTDLPCN